MKILIKTFFLFSLITTICVSCKNTNEPEINLKKTVNVVIPGSLSAILTTNELKSINKLIITGSIDARDFKTARDNMPNLDTLDISTVTIAAYRGNDGTSVETNHEYLANEIPSDAITLNKWNFCILLPNSITSIGNYAFDNCFGLKNITIPSSVTSIGNYAFDNCGGLDSIIIPNSVKTIGYYAFSHCTGISKLEIPNSVTSIGAEAFSYCSNLTNVSLGSGVMSIGSGAFMIGNDAFLECTELAAIVVQSDNPYFSSNDGVLFNKNQTNIITCPQGKKGSYCLLYTSPSPRDGLLSRMPSSA